MAFLTTTNLCISGIAAATPNITDCISDIYKWGGVSSFIETTGIRERRQSTWNITSADLCIEAAKALLKDLNWKAEEIDAIIFVSQTPDYILPATSPIIQSKLGVPLSCFTLDISLGCSGWVYALSVIASLMQNGTIMRGLLLAGDTITKICSPEDKSTYPLFGDAGTATAIEYKEGAEGFKFVLNSDGKGFETIIVNDGGFRNPVCENSFTERSFEENVTRNNLQLSLDGMNVFSFGITKAPKSVKELSSNFNIDLESIDFFTFHQANMMMNEMIRKKLKLPKDKVPYSMDKFGNTSSASIPLTLVATEAHKLRTENLSHIACGFGVGLSWGSVFFKTDHIKVPDLIEV